MCGRYTITVTLEELMTRYLIDDSKIEHFAANYNIAPMHSIPADDFLRMQKYGLSKQPFPILLCDGGIFSFAGLYDIWEDLEGKTEHLHDYNSRAQQPDGGYSWPHASNPASWRWVRIGWEEITMPYDHY